MQCENCAYSHTKKFNNNQYIEVCLKAQEFSESEEIIQNFKNKCNNRKIDYCQIGFAFMLLAEKNECPFYKYAIKSPQKLEFYEKHKDSHFYCDNKKCLWMGKGVECRVEDDNEYNILYCPKCYNEVKPYKNSTIRWDLSKIA